ncbi:telomerase inhibitor [Clarireedia jacksonii]
MLKSQGWTPGEYLGAKNASHAEFHTSANASHIRVMVKDNNLGLGAKIGSGVGHGECTGLDVFQNLLGRLNGKEEMELEREQKSREDLKRAIYAERKWGSVRFVRGGVLVGDKIQELIEGERERVRGLEGRSKKEGKDGGSESESSSEEEEVEEEEEEEGEEEEEEEKEEVIEEKKKSKKRKRSQQDDDDQETESPAEAEIEKKKSKKEKKEKKSKKRKAEETEEEASEPSPKELKKSKKDRKSKSKSSSESTPAPTSEKPEVESESARQLRKKEKKEKKEKKRRAAADNDNDDEPSKSSSKSKKEKKEKKKDKSSSDSTPSSTVPATATNSGRSTPMGIHSIRSRHIAQKRMASMDLASLNQVCLFLIVVIVLFPGEGGREEGERGMGG